MADRRSLFIKISIEDLEKSKEALKSLGADGEKAFRNMERAANDSSRKAQESAKGFLGVKTGIDDLDNALGGLDKSLTGTMGRLGAAALGAGAMGAAAMLAAEALKLLTGESAALRKAQTDLSAILDSGKLKKEEIAMASRDARAAYVAETEGIRALALAKLDEMRVERERLALEERGARSASTQLSMRARVEAADRAIEAAERALRLKMAERGAYPDGARGDPRNVASESLYYDPNKGKQANAAALADRQQLLKDLEKLTQDAARKDTITKAEEIEVRYELELEKWRAALDQRKINEDEFNEASRAAFDRRQGEIDKIAEEGAQKQAEALTKAHEEAAKESQRIWKRFYEDIADAVFDSLVPSGSQSPIARAFFRLAGSSLAQEFNPILSGLGLAAPLPGAQNSSLFNLGASLSGLTVFGRGLFTGPSGRLDPATGTPLPGGPGLLQQGLTGGATGFGIGSILSNLFPGTLNAGNSQIGGSLGGLAGGVAGGLGALGSTLGPFGGVIGGLLGSILGGLFGPKKPSVGPNSSAAILVGEGGALRVVGTGADNGGSVDSALALARGFATALDRLTETLGVRIAPHLNMAGQESGLGRVMGFQAGTFGGQFNLGFWGNEVSGTDAEDVVKRMLFRVLKDPRTGGFEGFSADVAKAIANSAAADLEGLLSDIEFAKGLRDLVDGLEASGDALKAVEVAARDAARTQVKAITDFFDRANALGFQAEALSGRDSLVQQLLDFSAKPEAVSETAKALAALGATLKVVRENAEALGVTEAEIAAAETAAKEELRKGFDEGIAQQILAIVDPVAAALKEYDRAAAARLLEARQAGADLVQVERLNALQRQQVLEQAGGAAASSLLKFWEDITFGGLSGASPIASLEGTRASFLAAAAQGDRGRIEDLGSQLLTRSRGAFASGSGFQSDLDLVRGIVGDFLGPQNAVVAAVDRGNAEQVRIQSQMLARMGDMADEIAALREDNARLNSHLQRLLVSIA